MTPSTRIALLLISFLSSTSLFAQEPELYWSKTYGGELAERGMDGFPVGDGFIFVCYGESFSLGMADVHIVRVDGSGDTLWTRTYGGPYWDEAYSIEPTKNGGVILGEQVAIGLDDEPGVPVVVKLDDNGEDDWSFFQRNSERFYQLKRVRETPDGNFVIVGTAMSLDSRTSGGWIAMLDAKGELLWSKTYEPRFGAAFTSIDFTEGNGFVVGGYINTSETETDAWLLQCDVLGDTLWTKSFGAHGNDDFSAIRVRDDGTVVCIGSTSSFSGRNNDVFYIKYKHSQPESLWVDVYGGLKDDVGNSLLLTDDGGCVIVGTTERENSDDFDAWLLEIDKENNVLWANRFGGSEYEEGMSIHHAPDGGYWVVGSSASFSNGPSDAWLLRLTPVPSSVSAMNVTASDIILDTPSPNPFNHITSLLWQIERPGHVTISVHDLLGRPVRTLQDEWLAAGPYKTEWNGTNAMGQSAPNGTYLYTINLNGEPLASGTIVLLR